jgi:branched-subunit amino acid transport protein AzlD
MNLSLDSVLIAVVCMTVVIFATRAFPFVLFSRHDPPAVLKFVEKYIPPMVMAILIVYCLKSVSFTAAPYGLPEVAALAVTVIAHLWKGNAMISIFGGTLIYMLIK